MIEAFKFNDLDGDGTKDSNEPYLDYWNFDLYLWTGSSWSLRPAGVRGAQGQIVWTTANGITTVPGKYKVVERLSEFPGWYVTTAGGTEQIITWLGSVPSPQCITHAVLVFGNKATCNMSVTVTGGPWCEGDTATLRAIPSGTCPAPGVLSYQWYKYDDSLAKDRRGHGGRIHHDGSRHLWCQG